MEDMIYGNMNSRLKPEDWGKTTKTKKRILIVEMPDNHLWTDGQQSTIDGSMIGFYYKEFIPPTDVEINDKSSKKEKYHFENMSVMSDFSVKFAAMCCGNSFSDCANWFKKLLQY